MKNYTIDLIYPFFIFYFLLPSVAFAFPGDLRSFVYLFFTTFSFLKPILTGLAFLLFFWGVAKFILSAGNEKELDNGRQFMIWGVLALFILISFWGIMQFLAVQFDFGPAGWPFLPVNGTVDSVNANIQYGQCIGSGC